MLTTAMAALVLAATPAFAQDAALRTAVEADYDANLGALFDHFHRNPELSGMETQTAERRAASCAKAGVAARTSAAI
ncbi:MAG: amidohydrolase, partial [Brevundimonas sp.]